MFFEAYMAYVPLLILAVFVIAMACEQKKQQKEIWQLREDFVSLVEEYQETKCHCQKGVSNGTQKQDS